MRSSVLRMHRKRMFVVSQIKGSQMTPFFMGYIAQLGRFYADIRNFLTKTIFRHF